MLKWIMAGVFMSLGSLAAYLFLYLGFWKSVDIERVHHKGYWLLYVDHTGPYHRIVPILSEVEKQAAKAHLPCPSTFGLFLDDPQLVDEDRLKSQVGCILPQAPDRVPEGLKFRQLEGGDYLHLKFTGSPAIGPLKVYPKARQWFQENRKTMAKESLEVYTLGPGGQLQTDYYFFIGGSGRRSSNGSLDPSS